MPDLAEKKAKIAALKAKRAQKEADGRGRKQKVGMEGNECVHACGRACAYHNETLLTRLPRATTLLALEGR